MKRCCSKYVPLFKDLDHDLNEFKMSYLRVAASKQDH